MSKTTKLTSRCLIVAFFLGMGSSKRFESITHTHCFSIVISSDCDNRANRLGFLFPPPNRLGRRFFENLSIAITWNAQQQELYVVQHGRDQLFQLWPEFYSEKQGSELPAEELMLVRDGSDFGWPYAYYDHLMGARMTTPEYGGDGKKQTSEGKYDNPILAFPGHWAPNDLLFYTGEQFPEKYRHGAFIAFHGSWNRAPLPQMGFNVVFVPFEGEKPRDDYYEIFADGFKGRDILKNPDDARWRPVGLAEGPDGSLYLSDSQKGRIWRIVYSGNGGSMPEGNSSHRGEIPASDTALETAKLNWAGRTLYRQHCLACHQADGRGVAGMQPSLLGSKKLRGDASETIRLVLEGSGWVKNSDYENVMSVLDNL
ncbi:MAG: PQQ-dependent sugar dehydrogenase, partial [Nitrospinae bacterium]|nr:PQQ-dependent sugar dehydrogenase [Nitrospinota bacterium]